MSLWAKLSRPAAKFSRDNRLLEFDETVIGVGDGGMFEHLIHEVSHAVTLDMPRFDPSCTPLKVSQLLKSWEDGGVWNETVTFAVEYRVWKILGAPFSIDDLLAAAEVQDCSRREVLAVINGDVDCGRDIEQDASEVIAKILALLNMD